MEQSPEEPAIVKWLRAVDKPVAKKRETEKTRSQKLSKNNK